MGYYDCITPAVIQRNVLENPGWYTQYTPYQAEIAQGRLEALLNFQTMVCDLTGLEVANASLLDEATAGAEAMTLCHALKPDRKIFFVSNAAHPQTIDVIQTRARALGIEIQVGDHQSFQFNDQVLARWCSIRTPTAKFTISQGSSNKPTPRAALVTVAADLLSLTILRPTGEFGADVAIGNTQRFGVPLGYGGPHAAFFATREAFKRQMPGRIVGVSRDSRGRPALRLALQTREQHIRREKATSNICTAQALLANVASMYACYHGPEGLKKIAQRIHLMAEVLAKGLERLGYKIGGPHRTSADLNSQANGDQSGRLPCFDTIRVDLGVQEQGRNPEAGRSSPYEFPRPGRAYSGHLARRNDQRKRSRGYFPGVQQRSQP